jgi:hypothetical protein
LPVKRPRRHFGILPLTTTLNEVNAVTIVQSDSRLASASKGISGCVSTALNRLLNLFWTQRLRRKTSELQGRSHSVSEHIRRTRDKVDFELFYLPWI